jgi:tetratricopeptide (TPR) repeat protein
VTQIELAAEGEHLLPLPQESNEILVHRKGPVRMQCRRAGTPGRKLEWGLSSAVDAALQQRGFSTFIGRVFAVRKSLAVLFLLLTAGPAPFAQTPGSRPTSVAAGAQQSDLTALRAAESALAAGDLAEAVRIYARLSRSATVSREVLAEAAVGLYRTGEFREAADAFRRFAAFAKGEEDLRYYYAVALYESGDYLDAQKELACALPYIEVTDDVLRYRAKIENTVAVLTRN